MMPRISMRLFLPALVAVAAACADSTAPVAGVTESMLTRDVAADAADATGHDLAEMAGMEALVGLPLTSSPMSPASAFANCVWNAGAQTFICPSITTPDGLTLGRWLAIYSGGISQQAYDPLTTDSLFFAAWLSGTVTGSDRTVWLKHARHLMVTGLTGSETERSWSGEGVREDSAHVNTDQVARTTRIQSRDVIDKVVYKLPRADFPFPQSGTITHDVTVSATTPNGTGATNRSGTRHVVIVFNGTRTASLTIGSTACSLDLVTRKLTCP
ncbi:MAG TPA: hypothetical protein VG432_02570 [Gemmatimonadaceae bacterium]|nr:hypothetical protein [Gemmatimonadaceae bacterium]